MSGHRLTAEENIHRSPRTMRFAGISLFALILLALPLAEAAPGGFSLTSPDFAQGGAIPSRFTCEGENISPTLEIAGVPAGAQSLVLIVEDPDAPAGTFTHWLVWNIPPGTTKLRGGAAPGGALQGTNDFGNAGYSGPCPPTGTHRYFFRLSALSGSLHLPAGASRKDLDNAIRGHVVARAVLMGRYAKTGSQ
jgi:Raf kinase inhibitor-like YbhB/YbcL family protein